MIDDKKIEEAAKEYSQDSWGYSYDIEKLLAFEQGAKWAINEFLKDLWHPASEKPRRNATCLAQIRDRIFETFYDRAEWKFLVKGYNVTRWLYIDDLLIKKGGKQ